MSNNKASISGGSWFNRINQGDKNGVTKISVWSIALGVLTALAAIVAIVGFLLSLGIISVN